MKKGFKSTASVILAIIMMLSAVPMLAVTSLAADVTEEKAEIASFKAEAERETIEVAAEDNIPVSFIVEKIPNTKELKIVGCMTAATVVTIPETFKQGYTVTAIGTDAFDDDLPEDMDVDNVSTVYLPKTIETIETKAFNSCKNLAKVEFLSDSNGNNSATEIAADAFFNCKGLKRLDVPKGVVKIGEKAFGYAYDDGVSPQYRPIDTFMVYCYSNTAAYFYATDPTGVKLNHRTGDTFNYTLNDLNQGNIPVKGIGINKTVSTLKSGEYDNLSVEFILDKVTDPQPTNKLIRWFSSDKTIATVSQSGKVTGIKGGSVDITAISSDGLFTKSCRFSIDGVADKKVWFTDALANVNNVPNTVVANPRYRYAVKYGTDPADSAVKFEYDSSFFTVERDKDDDIYYLQPKLKLGTSTLKIMLASDSTKYDTVKIKIEYIPVTGVKWTYSIMPFQSSYADGYIRASYEVMPADATFKEVTLTSSNTNVAAWITGDLLLPKMNGKTTLKVVTKDGGFYANVDAYIYGAPGCALLGLAFTKSSTSIMYSKSETLELKYTTWNKGTKTANATDTDAFNKAVTWKSSNESVAKVDANGKVTCYDAGTAVITATSKENPELVASCTVTGKLSWWQKILRLIFGWAM